jgi:predicted lactoylglutathione lyase
MLDFQYVTLFVQDVDASASFYAKLLGNPPIEQVPDFAMLPLREGVMLGLWSLQNAQPPATSVTGASEMAFAAANVEEVEATHVAWAALGLRIAQKPQRVKFGYTFVALDPDGHRLRVLSLAV